MQSSPLGFEVALTEAFDAAVERTREALKAEGFGVLTQIDMQGAFKEKLGKDFRQFAILGACNPPLAFKAMNTDPRVALMLPCNVTVEATPQGGSLVRIIDPDAMMAAPALASQPALLEVASDARVRLLRVAESLRSR